MIKACIFDLDGTLLDTIGAIQYFVNLHMQKNGLSEIDRAQTLAFVGDGARELIKRSIGASGIDTSCGAGAELLERILPEYVNDYDRDPLFLTHEYDGISDMLRELKAAGIKLGILSNKPDHTVKQLADSFFPSLFSAVRGAMPGMPLKPDPTPALALSSELGVMPSEVAYFGDTAVDIKTARGFGAGICCAVLWGFRTEEELRRNSPDICVSHASEICEKILPKGYVKQ